MTAEAGGDAVGDDGIGKVVLRLEERGLRGEEVGERSHAGLVVRLHELVVLLRLQQDLLLLRHQQYGLLQLVADLLRAEVEHLGEVLLLYLRLLHRQRVLFEFVPRIPPLGERHFHTDEDQSVARLAAKIIAEDVGLELAITVVRPYRHLRQSVRQHHAFLQLCRLDL